MKKRYKIHFTLSWSTVAFLALLMIALKDCVQPVHAADTNTVPLNTPVIPGVIIPDPHTTPYTNPAASQWGGTVHSNIQLNTEPTGPQKFWQNYYHTNHPAVRGKNNLAPNQPQGVSAAVAWTMNPPASFLGNEGHDNRAALNFQKP